MPKFHAPIYSKNIQTLLLIPKLFYCQLWIQKTQKQIYLISYINKILLSLAASKFEVVVFTASPGRYANKLLDILDPGHCLVHHRLDREHCHYHQVVMR